MRYQTGITLAIRSQVVEKKAQFGGSKFTIFELQPFWKENDVEQLEQEQGRGSPALVAHDALPQADPPADPLTANARNGVEVEAVAQFSVCPATPTNSPARKTPRIE